MNPIHTKGFLLLKNNVNIIFFSLTILGVIAVNEFA